jgi:bifunctional UDP-N-acetylglucosamine pyrophosphorylase/glucosamine-1-phosphate N-acetyltransferase
MLAYTLENLRLARIGEIVLVVGFKKNLLIKRFGGAVKIAIQKNPAGGTADAARAGFTLASRRVKTLLVINGDDSAFYRPETIQKVIASHREKKAVLSFVSLIKDDPFGLGRVIRDERGKVLGIIEEKDATAKQRKIKEINDGLYIFEKKWFIQNIRKVKKSPVSGEYYLVDLVKIALEQNQKVAVYTLPDGREWQGVNTPEELHLAEKKMKQKLGYG